MTGMPPQSRLGVAQVQGEWERDGNGNNKKKATKRRRRRRKSSSSNARGRFMTTEPGDDEGRCELNFTLNRTRKVKVRAE